MRNLFFVGYDGWHTPDRSAMECVGRLALTTHPPVLLALYAVGLAQVGARKLAVHPRDPHPIPVLSGKLENE